MPHKTFGGKGNVPQIPQRGHFGSRKLAGHSSKHKGVDFAAKHGTPLYDNSRGVVVRVYKNHVNRNGTPGFGGRIEIRYDNGYTATYSHMSEINVKVGDIVYEGVKIGITGGTPNTLGAGSTTGAHLHFELYAPSDENLNTFKRAPIDPELHMYNFENGWIKPSGETKYAVDPVFDEARGTWSNA